ncbi:MAG: hypothetical protein MSG64_03535 [Pyrinomonadaceae bacterium MAG19_C2-C3]|nr:hypothetical protein [Pyrinomonadaceae bacterium MAG19_C2-C3]
MKRRQLDKAERVSLYQRNNSAAFTRLSAKRHLDQPFDGWGRVSTNLSSPYLAGLLPSGLSRSG